MGADAVIGKATRKARYWLFSFLTGTEFGEGDVLDVEFRNVKTTAQIDKLEERRELMLPAARERILACTTLEKLTEVSATINFTELPELNDVVEAQKLFIEKANA